MSLLKQNISRKRRVDNKTLSDLDKDIEFEARGNKKYKVKAIIDKIVNGQ